MVKTKKLQKKRFFEVNSNLTASKIFLYAVSAEELNNRIVKIDLTRSLRGKSLELKLKIKAEGENITTEPVSLELAGSYIRRAFRKGVDYVEDSFVCECKDAKVIVKPFMLTRNKVSKSARRALRNNAREHILSYFKTRTVKELFTEIMNNKTQKEISLKLKKIYPLALCEIRVFEVVKDRTSFDISEKASSSESIPAKEEVKKVKSEDKVEKKVKAAI